MQPGTGGGGRAGGKHFFYSSSAVIHTHIHTQQQQQAEIRSEGATRCLNPAVFALDTYSCGTTILVRVAISVGSTFKGPRCLFFVRVSVSMNTSKYSGVYFCTTYEKKNTFFCCAAAGAGVHACTSRPLQWAVQNKHEACVKTLMELFPESSQMNVLDTNSFGKSALTDVSMSSDMVLSVLCFCVVTHLKGSSGNYPQTSSVRVPCICTTSHTRYCCICNSACLVILEGAP